MKLSMFWSKPITTLKKREIIKRFLRYEHPENPNQEYYETTLNISVK